MVGNVYIVQGYPWDLKKFEVTSENQKKYEVTNGNFPSINGNDMRVSCDKGDVQIDVNLPNVIENVNQDSIKSCLIPEIEWDDIEEEVNFWNTIVVCYM